MHTQLTLDIVSDVSCPWCIVGYKALEQALQNVAPDIQATITWQPFELNPQMPMQGQEIVEHITEKYGISEEQAAQNRETIKQRGLSVGYEFGERGGGRIYNTFDAHRLLHWAHELDQEAHSKGTGGNQTALKLALFDLYFQQEGNPSDHQQLLAVVEKVGLNVDQAKHILATDKYAVDVRKIQQHYQSAGVSSVPAVIVNNKHLISGGQPVEVFEAALREIAKESE
ncbi:DsbA family oxidoreductase [Paraglaciecola aquimarina]|uniref:DsbA family oxidoreductase n=1 Tax=Paraglaciecola aquimarina TaxID=1235557 RepID=A0ABU3SS69_9ALTE|nr:DsbA family oxidoreductase [Paraglaciecola aquimarina]MDU0352862.1 DsbA family oxidoreductase [Paraglaciecola aquimarina]